MVNPFLNRAEKSRRVCGWMERCSALKQCRSVLSRNGSWQDPVCSDHATHTYTQIPVHKQWLPMLGDYFKVSFKMAKRATAPHIVRQSVPLNSSFYRKSRVVSVWQNGIHTQFNRQYGGGVKPFFYIELKWQDNLNSLKPSSLCWDGSALAFRVCLNRDSRGLKPVSPGCPQPDTNKWSETRSWQHKHLHLARL